VVPVGPPDAVESAHHWLWRFWRRLPRPGRMLVFDRSWYGRVLVERVEGYAPERAWRRGYEEIVEFEAQLTDKGFGLAKFWLHIDQEEQDARFSAREDTPYKKYKITEDDYRNRERWDDYVVAAEEMFARTGTDVAPWHLVAANDKRWARVQVLEEVCATIEQMLHRH
jgi:polyphosphate kinase 2 (PPK2 family)